MYGTSRASVVAGVAASVITGAGVTAWANESARGSALGVGTMAGVNETSATAAGACAAIGASVCAVGADGGASPSFF